MPVYVDESATEVITREAYFELERKLQDFRLRVIRLAVWLARSENRYEEVQRHHVYGALRRFSSQGLDWSPPVSEPVSTFPQDPFMYLEKRIHNLRILLTQLAARFARDESSRSESDTPVRVAPSHVHLAWERVAQSPSVLHSTLLESAGRE